MAIYKVSFEMRVRKPLDVGKNNEKYVHVREQMISSVIIKMIDNHFKKDVQIGNLKVTEVK
jgi:hypothetical protein